ncbi:MAG: hypothetical protein ACRBBN_06815 [Methyloligellaceae bacterium]
MATRSSIAYQNVDGSVHSIYCHYDGYPEHNGKILKENYKSFEKVKNLIALGDISSLGIEINPKNDEPHNFDDRQSGVTVAYHRDRKENWENVKPNEYYDITAWLRHSVGNCGFEYLYILKKGIDGNYCWCFIDPNNLPIEKL